jgi:urea transporter
MRLAASATWSARSLPLWASAVARLYAGVLFSSSRRVGGLIFLATLLTPRAGALGLAAVLSAALSARCAGLVGDVKQLSAYGYSALYLGLGASQTFLHPLPACTLATLGATASVFLGAGIGHWTGRIGLPALSLPFLIVYSGALAAGRVLGADWTVVASTSGLDVQWVKPLALCLHALAGLVWSPEPLAGLLVLVALVLHGRVALLLAALALCAPLALDRVLALDAQHVLLGALVNGVLAALGLGCCWFTPSLLSFVRAGLGVFLCTVLTASLADPLGRLGIATLSLPFNLSVFLMLLATRQSPRRSVQAGAQPLHARASFQLPAVPALAAAVGSEFRKEKP